MPVRIEKDVLVLAGGAAVVPGTTTEPLAVSTDWDTFREEGVYLPSGTPSNAPRTTGPYVVMVFDDPAATNDVWQLAISPTRARRRRYQSGTWGDWADWSEFDIHGLTNTLTVPASGDLLAITDASDSNEIKKVTYQTLYDAIRAGIKRTGGYVTKTLRIVDSAVQEDFDPLTESAFRSVSTGFTPALNNPHSLHFARGGTLLLITSTYLDTDDSNNIWCLDARTLEQLDSETLATEQIYNGTGSIWDEKRNRLYYLLCGLTGVNGVAVYDVALDGTITHNTSASATVPADDILNTFSSRNGPALDWDGKTIVACFGADLTFFEVTDSGVTFVNTQSAQVLRGRNVATETITRGSGNTDTLAAATGAGTNHVVWRNRTRVNGRIDRRYYVEATDWEISGTTLTWITGGNSPNAGQEYEVEYATASDYLGSRGINRVNTVTFAGWHAVRFVTENRVLLTGVNTDTPAVYGTIAKASGEWAFTADWYLTDGDIREETGVSDTTVLLPTDDLAIIGDYAMIGFEGAPNINSAFLMLRLGGFADRLDNLWQIRPEIASGVISGASVVSFASSYDTEYFYALLHGVTRNGRTALLRIDPQTRRGATAVLDAWQVNELDHFEGYWAATIYPATGSNAQTAGVATWTTLEWEPWRTRIGETEEEFTDSAETIRDKLQGLSSGSRLSARFVDDVPEFGEQAAEPREELHAQVLERDRVDDELSITSGLIADTSGHVVERYGYSKAAGPAGYLQGGSIARTAGGSARQVTRDALLAAWTHSGVSRFRFTSDTDTIHRLRIGSTYYLLTQIASDASDATWGNVSYDEYEVASTETNRDPLRFTSTSSTVDDLQFLFRDGRPLNSYLTSERRALDQRAVAEWVGVDGVEHALAGLSSESVLLVDAIEASHESEVFALFHHPTASVPSGASTQDIYLPNGQTLRFRRGDSRIYYTDATAPDDYTSGTDFTREIEATYFRNHNVPENPRSGVVVIELGRAGDTDIRATFLYDIDARKMVSASPGDAEFSPDADDIMRVVWFASGASSVIADSNFIAPAGNSARAANTYRLYGAQTELNSVRAELAAWSGRGDGTAANLVFRDADGLVQTVAIGSYGAVSEDTGNKLWHYLDLTFGSQTRVLKPPAHRSPVVVTVPRAPAEVESQDFLQSLGDFDSGSSNSVFADTGIDRSGAAALALSINDSDIHLFLERDLDELDAVTLGENGFRADAKTWMREGGDIENYIGRTADGHYAISPARQNARFELFQLNADVGFTLTEEGRNTAGINLTTGGTMTVSTLDIPDSDLIGLQLNHPQAGTNTGNYRLFLIRREDLLDRLPVTDGAAQAPANLVWVDYEERSVVIGRTAAGKLAFAVRSTYSGSDTRIYPVVWSITRADGFGLGSGTSRNVTTSGVTDIPVPSTKFFAVSPGSEETNDQQFRDISLRIFQRSSFVRYNAPDATSASSYLSLESPDGHSHPIATRNSRIWLHVNTQVPRMRPFRVYPVNARSDPQAASAPPTGAFIEILPRLIFEQDVSGAAQQVIRESNEAGISIVWPDDVDHLKVTLTPNASFTGYGRMEYREPGGNTWRTVHGIATGAPILVTARRSYPYRFSRSAYRSTPASEVSQLKLRLTRVNESNVVQTTNFAGAVNVEVDYESDADSHATKWTTFIDEDVNTVTLTPQPAPQNLSGLTWHDENFTTPLEYAKIQEMVAVIVPTNASGNEDAVPIRLSRIDMDYIGNNPGIPGGADSRMHAAAWGGFVDGRQGPVMRPRADYVARFTSGPAMLVGLKVDGVYLTGVRFAVFRYTHEVRMLGFYHTV